MIQNMLKNWKTTTTGLIAIIGGINLLIFSSPVTPEIITAAATAILTGAGFLFARDGDKTSEQVGANKPLDEVK